MTDNELLDQIRALSRPLEPKPTEIADHLVPLEGIEAVLFDIYGTLFISAAGDIGVGLVADGDEAFKAALQAVNLPAKGEAAMLSRAIKADHARKRSMGIEYPEVDITDIWQQVLTQLGLSVAPERLQRLALEYELRVNPVWPMPGLAATLEALRQRGLKLGLISNAQFFTPLLFPALLGRSLPELGFSCECCVFSWQVGEAKPSRRLFDLALQGLKASGIQSRQVLYLGNDRLNDLLPAELGRLCTGLVAGDARSLRLREGEARSRGVKPDLVF